MIRFSLSGSFMTLASLFTLIHHVVGQTVQTWPSSVDELEDIMFLSNGYNSRGFVAFVQPCGFSTTGLPNRANSAEWLRTAFHDMATAWVQVGTGGMDASLIFELAAPTNNLGQGFNDTISNMTPFLTSRSSMADLFAMGVYASVRACGGPVIPIKTGRIDASAGGTGFATNTPLAQDSVGTFIGQFAHMGFSQTEMIQVVACGHTLGGVHATEFPNVIPVGHFPDDFVPLDSTQTVFDNAIITEYLNGTTPDPLTNLNSFAVQSGTTADTRVFNSDKNVTVSAMVDSSVFMSTCQTVLQKMIETVPSNVKLTNPIVVYEVKPSGIQLSLMDGGNSMSFTGSIRVRTTSRDVSSVVIIYTDRNGNPGASTITTTYQGQAFGLDDNFKFYGFSATFSSTTSISSFVVQVTTSDGTTTTFDNNGGGFPVQDIVLYQPAQSCIQLSNNPVMNVWAAVRSTTTNVPTLNLTLKVPRTGGVIPPKLTQQQVNMTSQGCMGPYTIYSANPTISGFQQPNTKFDITVPGYGDTFKDSSLMTTVNQGGCSTFSSLTACGASSSSSSSSSVASSSSSSSSSSSDSSSTTSSATSSSISTSPTTSSSASSSLLSSSTASTSSGPSNPSSTAFSYQGCYVDNSARVLNSASTSSPNAMTVESCANFCSSWQYFGLEYGT